MNVKKYWDQKITLEEYIAVAKERLQSAETPEDFKEYYRLGLQRMERTTKQFEVLPADLDRLKDSEFDGKILIISEPWCGDASSTVPATYLFFKMGGVPVGIFLRDQDQTLIDAYQTNGTQSIPKILVLNTENEVVATWGPRTVYGTSLLARYKQNPEAYPKTEFYNDLQVYYARNKGKDVIEEILKVIENITE